MSPRPRVTSLLAHTIFTLMAILVAANLRAAPEYKIIDRYPMEGGDFYDFIHFDPASRRLFVSHYLNVEVLDGDSGKLIGRVPVEKDVRGIAIAQEFNHGFTSNATSRSATMFDLKTLKALRTIKYTGVKPDAIEYDAESKRVFIANGDGGNLTVLSPKTGDIVGVVELGGEALEMFAFDGKGRGFVNDEGRSSICVFDTHTLEPKALWPLAPGEEPSGLAIDLKNHRLFSVCANGMMVVLDSDTGRVITTAPIGGDPDGVAYEPATRRIFSSNKDGTLTVIQQESADKYTVVQNVKTEFMAKTMALDLKTGRVFLPTGKFSPAPVATKEAPKPKAPLVPGSFTVLVVGP